MSHDQYLNISTINMPYVNVIIFDKGYGDGRILMDSESCTGCAFRVNSSNPYNYSDV